jgi:hypothetical protein
MTKVKKLISRELVGGAALSVALINRVVAAFDGACHRSVICAADARTSLISPLPKLGTPSRTATRP